MTDEEMAEEYAKAHMVQYPKRVIISENGFCTSEDEVKQAFLDGLKAGSQLDEVWHDYDAGEDCYEDSHEGRWVKREAGRPQWHDLRENPNDLPEAHWKNWVIAVYDGGILWCRARREKCVDGVYWVNSYHRIIENVVMWMKIEIPM